MSYELAAAYAETFGQDPGWITAPPLPESVGTALLQGAIARGTPVTVAEMDAAYVMVLGTPCPTIPPEVRAAEETPQPLEPRP